MRKMRKILALCLAALLLSGCVRIDSQYFLRKLAAIGSDVVRYEGMAYTRPDMAQVQTALDEVCDAARGSDLDLIVDKIYGFYDVYDSYYTDYSLADIKYCGDLTDPYWSGEYDYCAEHSAENLVALYDRIVLEYGFDSIEYDPREFVETTHYFTNPMYIISYVVSNDAAVQLYQMEQQEAGAGLRCFEENLATEDAYFLEFLKNAGLESPFAPGRIAEIRATFENILN